jgi:dTDP-glucose pyrophosphorylase
LSGAILVLDREDSKIVLVVDESGQLLGTITDGDIRRGLLNGVSLEDRVSIVMNSDPKACYLGEDPLIIKSRMKSLAIRQMPILNKERVVCGLETLKHFSDTVRRHNPVMIMAGGFGKRLRPLTDNVPKPMLKVGGKPILEHIIERFVEAGLGEFYISTHYKAEIVREYFGDGARWGIEIQYIHEDEPLGTAGALRLLPSSITKLPLIMINGDILTNINYANLIDFHEKHQGLASICVKEYEYQVPYGVIEWRDNKFGGIVEKPIKRFFVNAGIYVLDNSLLNARVGDGYQDMPNLLDSVILSGGEVTTFPVHEYWMDIGHMEEFKRAQREVDWMFEK